MMHVWRLPLENFASLLAFCAIITAWALLALYRRRAASELARGVLLGVGVVATMLSPLFVQAIVDPELSKLALRGAYIHYGPAIYAGPAIAAALLFFLSRRTIRAANPRMALARGVFWLTAVVLATLNLANWCNPGWCARFGFPFPYSWWSDAILIMNGVNFSEGTNPIAIIADAAILLLGVILLPRAFFMRTAKPSRT
ncbi:MAG: hypothetical protein QOC81_3329 [Thermoanaerobaculia bacterium]|nr:hypothetical protein [Thermoanaerobaculia bacterium]